MTVVDWLLDSDPSIRWQVMRDLTHERPDVIAAERSRGAVYFDMDEGEGKPSRWNTLRAMWVLDWYEHRAAR